MADAGKQQQLDEAAKMVWDHNRQTVERARDAGRHLPGGGRRPAGAVPAPRADAGRNVAAPGRVGRRRHATGAVHVERRAGQPIVASRMNTLRAEREIQRNAVMQAFGG